MRTIETEDSSDIERLWLKLFLVYGGIWGVGQLVISRDILMSATVGILAGLVFSITFIYFKHSKIPDWKILLFGVLIGVLSIIIPQSIIYLLIII